MYHARIAHDHVAANSRRHGAYEGVQMPSGFAKHSRVGPVALLLLVAMAGGAIAQTDRATARAEAGAEEFGAEGARLIADLQATVEQERVFEQRLAAASDEDSLVLRLQLLANEDRLMALLKELAKAVPAAGGTAEQQALRARADAIFPQVTPEVWRLIAGLRHEIDGLRALRPVTAAADRLDLEDRIILLTRRLDTILQYGREHITDLEGLGFDTTEERARFAQLLDDRAEELVGRIDLGVLRMDQLKVRSKEKPGDADVGQLLLATRKNLDANAASLGVTVGLMEAMGLPVAGYQAELMTVTQDISSGLLNPQVTATLLRRGWTGFVGWLRTSGPGYLVKIILAALIILAGWLLAKLVRKTVEKSLRRSAVNISLLLHRTIVSSAYRLVLFMAAMIALAQFGISLGPMLAGLGVVGFILGFALQDSLSNFAAGMMILFYRPYDVGDFVEISGVFGKVEHMSMVSTSILTVDNQKLVVPNSKIWGDVIKNVTDQKIRRVDMVFGISYSDDIPHAEQVLEGILADNERVLADPAPVVRLHKLNDSSVDFVVRPWVKTDDYWDVYWEITRTVKMRFDAEEISIPFPQRDVHIHEVKPARHGGEAPGGFAGQVTGTHDPDPVAGGGA